MRSRRRLACLVLAAVSIGGGAALACLTGCELLVQIDQGLVDAGCSGCDDAADEGVDGASSDGGGDASPD